MIDINLISTNRLRARKQRAQMKRWFVICLTYSVVLLVSCGVYRVIWNLTTPDVEAELLDLHAQTQSIQETIDQIQARLVESNLSLEANRELKEHPDWSLLLRFLASMLGDDLFLRECDIQMLSPSTVQAVQAVGQDRSIQQADDPASQSAVRLSVRGMGRSLEAVSQFALRIEQTQLFTQVKLVDTRSEPYLKDKVIAFRVECTLGTVVQGDG